MLSWLMLDILQHLLFSGHFLVALTFCNYILGLTGADEAISSQRVQGRARESYLTKRRLQQRPPLRVEYVKALEIMFQTWLEVQEMYMQQGAFCCAST